ncbi:hypothetical protein Tco_1518103, partial [Tanacetum coccineum]
MITTVQSAVKIVTQQHEQAVQKEQEEQAAFTPYWKIPIIDDDDDEYTIQYREYLENSSNAITPDLPTEEPDNSLSMGDEHLSTIPETESDEVIKSSVEDLVPIPSESEDTSIDYSPKIDSLLEEFTGELAPINPIPSRIHPEEDIHLIEQLLHDDTSSDDDSYEDIIESLNDNPIPDYVLKSPSPFPIPVEDIDSFFEMSDTSLSYSDNSLPEFETFSDYTEETSSDSTTTHSDNSLPEYDLFLFEIEPDQGELTSVVMEDILGEPRVHVPNELPTHPTLMLDSDFIPSDDSFGPDLEVSFPSGSRNKIFDPGIFFKVQSKRFLSQDTSSISFIRNPLCLVIETLLPGMKWISEKRTKNEAKTDKTEHGIEEREKPKSQSQSQPRQKSKVKAEAVNKEILNGPTRTHLMGQIPSGESKVHIEVLLVLWGNRLPIPDGSLPLS